MPKKRQLGGSQSDLRRANQQLVINELLRRGPLTQADIAAGTKLAPSTVSNIVSQLAKKGQVLKDEAHGGPYGRLITLVPPPGLVAGIECGHRHLVIVIADRAHNVVAETRLELDQHHDCETDLRFIWQQVLAITKDAGADTTDLAAACLALPAPVDVAGTRITSKQIFRHWYGVNIKELAEEIFGVPVAVENDANTGAIGEYIWGAAQGVDQMIYLKLANGLGVGMVLDGHLYRGASGAAGELGHTTIDEYGKVCRCGNRGCLETIASVPAILELLKPVFGPQLKIQEVITMAQEGNTACIRVLEDVGRIIGIALANLANLINPKLILLGGSLAEAGDILIEPIHRALKRYAISSVTEQIECKASSLGVRSHALGAVSVALQLVK